MIHVKVEYKELDSASFKGQFTPQTLTTVFFEKPKPYKTKSCPPAIDESTVSAVTYRSIVT